MVHRIPRPGSTHVTSICVAGPNHGLTRPVQAVSRMTSVTESTLAMCGAHSFHAVTSVRTACTMAAGAATGRSERITR